MNEASAPSVPLQYHDFLQAASGLTAEALALAPEHLASAAALGRWHPNGFAIFDILTDPEVGTARIHVWPLGGRQALKLHPRVHNHGFHVYATVLSGVYRECLFERVIRSDQRGRRAVYLSEYAVRSPGNTNVDQVEPTGRSVLMRTLGPPTDTRQGGSHALPAGAYHATLISMTQFCATLAVLGPRHPGFTDILLGQRGFLAESRQREIVIDAEREEIVGELLPTLMATTPNRSPFPPTSNLK